MRIAYSEFDEALTRQHRELTPPATASQCFCLGTQRTPLALESRNRSAETEAKHTGSVPLAPTPLKSPLPLLLRTSSTAQLSYPMHHHPFKDLPFSLPHQRKLGVQHPSVLLEVGLSTRSSNRSTKPAFSTFPDSA